MRYRILLGCLALAAVLSLCPRDARAQFTVVTGTVTDPNGLPYSNATISAQIVNFGGVSPTLNGQSFTGQTSPVQLNAVGAFTMRLADNNVVLPAGTMWRFRVNQSPGIAVPFGTGPQTFALNITITGASQSISATLSAAAPAQTIGLGGSGVSSINTLTGAIVLAAGTNITLTPVGNTITIAATSGAPTLAATQIGFGSAGNTLTGSANMTYTVATGILSLTDPTSTTFQPVVNITGSFQCYGFGLAAGFGEELCDNSGVAMIIRAGGATQFTLGSTLANFIPPVAAPSFNAFQYLTTINCSSSASPAVCTSAAAGSVVVAAAATSVVVNTTAVTANSQILLMYDSSLGTRLSVTCNATEPALYGVTARSAGVSFTLTSTAPITNPACFSYFIVN